MAVSHDVADKIHPEQVMSHLFRKHTPAEFFHRVVAGLRSPRNSGEYKFARLQLLRLQAPVAAVTVPLLVLLFLLWYTSLTGRLIDVYHPVFLPEPEPLPKLEYPEPAKPPNRNSLQSDANLPGFAEIGSETPVRPDWAPLSPRTELREMVAPIESPRIFPGLFPSTFSERHRGALIEGRGTRTTEDAVMRALRWLQDVQESDGSWSQESGNGPGLGAAPAMTGLALLTFLAHNETTGSPEFGTTVQRGLQWLVRNQEYDGGFRGRDSHDYSRPIAAYALCEAYALMKLPALREPAEKSIRTIVSGQNPAGGWNYNCKPGERNDTSYTGWCVQALRAAEFAKLNIPGLDPALRKAVDGLRANAHPQGGFGYTSRDQSHLTSVGVLCLQLLGAGKTVEARLGLRWLEGAYCRWNAPWGSNPLYYWYYATQAKFHASETVWDRWNEQMSLELPRNQTVLNPDDPIDSQRGYWKACSESEHCKSYVYNTALCTLMLEVYYRHLKTFAEPEALSPEVFVAGGDEIRISM